MVLDKKGKKDNEDFKPSFQRRADACNLPNQNYSYGDQREGDGRQRERGKRREGEKTITNDFSL